jgi:hypothetical protein
VIAGHLAAEVGKAALDDRVLSAMAKVPRHEFVPVEVQPYAYLNRPLPIGFDKTISDAIHPPGQLGEHPTVDREAHRACPCRRGKRLVVMVGQKKAVAIAVRNASGRRRWSKLQDWLRLGSPV